MSTTNATNSQQRLVGFDLGIASPTQTTQADAPPQEDTLAQLFAECLGKDQPTPHPQKEPVEQKQDLVPAPSKTASQGRKRQSSRFTFTLGDKTPQEVAREASSQETYLASLEKQAKH